MKQDNLDQQLKSMTFDIPSVISERIDQTLAALPDSPPVQAPVKPSLFKRWGRKKTIVVASIVALLFVPTSTYAYKKFLTDEVFGSYAKFKSTDKSGNGSEEEYQKVGQQLQDARNRLSEADYQEFVRLGKEQVRLLAPFVTEGRYVDFSKMTPGQRAQIKVLMTEFLPYIDHSKGLISSTELLTPEEFDRYLEAGMTRQIVLTKYKIVKKEPEEINKDLMSPEDRKAFEEATAFINKVKNMQLASPRYDKNR